MYEGISITFYKKKKHFIQTFFTNSLDRTFFNFKWFGSESKHEMYSKSKDVIQSKEHTRGLFYHTLRSFNSIGSLWLLLYVRSK